MVKREHLLVSQYSSLLLPGPLDLKTVKQIHSFTIHFLLIVFITPFLLFMQYWVEV